MDIEKYIRGTIVVIIFSSVVVTFVGYANPLLSQPPSPHGFSFRSISYPQHEPFIPPPLPPILSKKECRSWATGVCTKKLHNVRNETNYHQEFVSCFRQYFSPCLKKVEELQS